MKYLFFYIIIAATLTGCCAARRAQSSERRVDSLRVDVRHRTVYIHDTLLLKLPAERVQQIVREDSSHLETSAAVSDARINPDGSLFHSLENKQTEQPVPVERPVEYRDSVVYRDRLVKVEVEKTEFVERDLSWWQKTQIRGFWAAIIFLVIIYRKKIFQAVVRLILKK